MVAARESILAAITSHAPVGLLVIVGEEVGDEVVGLRVLVGEEVGPDVVQISNPVYTTEPSVLQLMTAPAVTCIPSGLFEPE